MDIDNISQIQKGLKQVVEENKKLQSLKSRYMQHAESLRELATEIQAFSKKITDIAGRIDPVVNVTKGSWKVDRKLMKERVSELYQKLQEGTQMDMKFLKTLYPEMKEKEIYYYLVLKLAALPRVEKTRDGMTIRLFYKG